MSQVNPLTRELLVKLVYYGPGLGGKTTSLQRVHASSPPETRGQIVSLATPVDRTLYFDFLPLRLPAVRNLHVRLQLFTVPGQVYFNATRKLVLTGADGVVFVADSQRERLDANLESLENLQANLEEQGRSVEDVPLVLQYNKRDLPGVVDIAELEGELNPRADLSFATCATTGEGVLDALDALVQRVLSDLESRNVLGLAHEAAEQPQFARAEAALEDQIGRASEEIWRSTLERALSDAPPAPSAPSVRPRKPSVPAPPSRPASAASGSASLGPSWVAWFPDEPGELRAVEAAFGAADYAAVITLCAAMADGIVARVGAHAGAGASAAAVVGLLGLSGPRWLSFRAIVERARGGGAEVLERDALAAYAMVIELRLAEHRAIGRG
jgi:mutual gliding-motility protein MglA